MSLIINYIIYVICISKNLKYLKNEARNQKLKCNLLCLKVTYSVIKVTYSVIKVTYSVIYMQE